MNLRFPLAALAAMLALTASPLLAQVPQLISYQGRVAVGGANFTGPAPFRFALVNAPGTTTYWSNDGTSSGGAQPVAAVSLPVANGLYSVLLGDATLANMMTIPAAVFDNSDVRLRVWFDDGIHGIQQLAPDQRIAAVGYAVIAGNVPDGAITAAKLAPGAVTSASIAAGAITGSQLAAGAAAANLSASGQSGVASGGTILGNTSNNAALAAAGYVYLGSVNLPDSWTGRSSVGAPFARYRHSTVWTGSEMLIWGGILGGTGVTPTYLSDGARYNPATDSWTTISSVGTPAARALHSAVWTGTEMIVWGGANGSSAGLATGGRFNLANNLWVATSTGGTPIGRRYHTAVWTGSEMIVWGGESAASVLQGDGSRYTPASDSWSPLTNVGGPSTRAYHTAVWTGTEMIVYGGTTNISSLPFPAASDGARYTRASNSWTTLPILFAPTGRFLHSVAWTGTEMYVWGGVNGSGQDLNDGSRYTPGTNSWNGLTTTNAPSKRDSAPAVWTGSHFIVWGGQGGSGVPPTDGGQFNAATNTWTATSAVSPPPARVHHSLVWTGSEMLTFGGITDPLSNTPAAFNDVWAYSPTRTMYLYSKP